MYLLLLALMVGSPSGEMPHPTYAYAACPVPAAAPGPALRFNGQPPPASPLRGPDAVVQEQVQAPYAQLPLQFEVNQGQVPAEATHVAHGPGYDLALTATQATLTLWRVDAQGESGLALDAMKTWNAKRLTAHAQARAVQSATVHIHFVGANPHAIGAGVNLLPGHVNYVKGTDPKDWHTKIATYARVKYENVYPGVAMVYYGNSQGQLEYDFVVAPGADPCAILLGFEGATSLAMDEQGDLVLQTAVGELRQQRPQIYQEVAGVRRAVSGGYVLQEAHEVGFEVGPYDVTRPLVIDPVLVYATYMGGSGYPFSGDKDLGVDIAVDAEGNTYVTGATNSIGHWHADAFVVKFDPTGSELLYETYLDGDGEDDNGRGIAVDAAGNAYVTGHYGNLGAFAAKLNPTGSPLYNVYFGGESGFSLNYGSAIAVDASGNAYVTGEHGILGTFPTTPDAYQPEYGGGNSDAFVVKLNGQGEIVYATFLGGNEGEAGLDITVDAAGNAYVAGGTASDDFPTTPGAFQEALGGDMDVFVTKVNPNGSALVYSSYMGGTGGDTGSGIAIDSDGNAYVAGMTAALGENTFPTVNPYKSTYSGGVGDSYYFKLNADGSALVYSSYLSGHLGHQAGDAAYGIAVDADGYAYVTGETTSLPEGYLEAFPRHGFPVVDALQPDLAGAADAFVTKISPSGATLVYSTYLGGEFSDAGGGVAVDAQGNVYVTGQTLTEDFPTTPGAFQPAYGGGDCTLAQCSDAFVAKISETGPGTVSIPLDKPWGWSLASLPTEMPPGKTLNDRFDHLASALTYSQQHGYAVASTPAHGEGFWLQLSEDEKAFITGLRVDRYTRMLEAGWSLIGGLSDEPARVTTDPPGALAALFRFEPGTGDVFEFDDGYQPTDTIPAGEGAWIHCTEPCEVTAAPAGGTAPPDPDTSRAFVLTARGEALDGSVSVGRVVLGVSETDAAVPYPPAPPAYTTLLRLLTPGDLQAPRYSDLRRGDGEAGVETWVLEIDPNGNTPEHRTTTLYWDPAALSAIADVPWTLREGSDGTGTVLMDLRDLGFLEVSGTELQHFTLSAGLTGITAEEEAVPLPAEFALLGNYPNPFNPATQIHYDVPAPGPVTIRVYNVLGQHVRTLLDGTAAAGRHAVSWDGRNASGLLVPSGVYFCRMEAQGGRFAQTRRMVLMK